MGIWAEKIRAYCGILALAVLGFVISIKATCVVVFTIYRPKRSKLVLKFVRIGWVDFFYQFNLILPKKEWKELQQLLQQKS